MSKRVIVSATVLVAGIVAWHLITAIDMQGERLTTALRVALSGAQSDASIEQSWQRWWRVLRTIDGLAIITVVTLVFGALPMSLLAMFLDRYPHRSARLRRSARLLRFGLVFQLVASPFVGLVALLGVIGGEWVVALCFGIPTLASLAAIGVWRRTIADLWEQNAGVSRQDAA